MGYFPFFIDIKGKRGLVVGGGRIAAHKVEKLRPFGAKLTVIAPVIRKELIEDKSIICLEREFEDSDIREQFFVIAASDNRELNAHIGHICREKGILVNVVDDRENCGFLFPALVKEGRKADSRYFHRRSQPTDSRYSAKQSCTGASLPDGGNSGLFGEHTGAGKTKDS